MKNKEDTLDDSIRRFKTDKNFKNTILKNCSRLRQNSTDDHYINRKNINQQKYNSVKKITNIKKRNSLRENILLSKDINNISKKNISIDSKNNIQEKRRIKLRFDIRKAFLNYNLESNNDKEKTNNFDKKENKFSFISVNKKKIKENNLQQNYEKNHTIQNQNNELNENNKIKKLDVKKNQNIKRDIKDSNKELTIEIDEKNLVKEKNKRTNSIRRIMNSFYYHSYTSESKEKTNLINNNEKEVDNNNLKNSQILKRNHNSVINNSFFNKNKEKEQINVNYNSNINYIYKKKYKNLENILHSVNLLFNTNSTGDNSCLTNESNKELPKENVDNQNEKLIKVKMVYQKPNKRNQLIKENIIIGNTISYNKTVQRITKRRILFEKKMSENCSKENSREKNQKIILTPIERYKEKHKLVILSKNSDNKINIKNVDNPIRNENINYKYNYIIEFFDDIIELCNGIEENNILDKLKKNINKKYIIDYKKFINKQKNEINENFEYCFKYFCIIFINFFFLSKDEILYKYNSIKFHLLFIQYIYSSLCFIGYQDLDSKNIKQFFQDYHFKKKVSIIQCTTSMIKLLFDGKEEYCSLNNVLKQLMVNSRTTKIEDIIKIMNQTILYCFNSKEKERDSFPLPKKRNSAINKIYKNNFVICKDDSNKNEEIIPIVPYIKTNMRKKFCLVLDLDETICHSLKLNFGYYFLLRPGTIDFLVELSELYEIIIFTSSPKDYADNIIDKIDEKGILISHRLYKPHVIFERGKSVKKLNLIGRDLNKIIFVDNMKSNAKYNPKNLYLIPSWKDDIYDDELIKLKNKLKYIFSSGKFNDDITKAL